jgi:hypothetical protein
VDAGAGAPASPAVPAAPSAAESYNRCFLKNVGIYGNCMTASACASLGSHLSTPGYCTGPTNMVCCTAEPRIEDHPHPPTGYLALPQAQVTSEMTAWALMIVGAPTTYPMGSRTTQTFGARDVMARVEWHPPDFGHGVIHRGVTLYEPR